ncbi:MAG: hypothetical protein L7F77_10405 [Candidatus Magnetominusculus sp. LBB02]|nr:hypothetical protein [Candidatus Magnetominusculus sp. LBB02]
MRTFLLSAALVFLLVSLVNAEDPTLEKASVSGKYSKLVQMMPCAKDKATYGEFNDYGQWSGGPWCGQTGKAGYWVYVAPNWYVWGEKNK